MSEVIQVENLSKQYRLGKIGTGSFAHDVNRWWHRIRGKEDPYLKIGEVNDRTTKGESDFVWSLRDINFSINQGDAVGIIGRNGAGKSTLLKILSRVTAPTTGSIRVKGRVASLLEVGTGFHPELTGRENIFLNGAILGMNKREIASKFDEIIDFSGVERYIDTPVKRYSSGMYVRLAFAVAAHLESEILIVDEVLAVGDAEFQKKCMGKMNDVSKGEGRTVLFVSHNMASIKRLCTKGIVLRNGTLSTQGDIDSCVMEYQKSAELADSVGVLAERKDRAGNQKLKFTSISVLNNGNPILCGEQLIIELTYKKNIAESLLNIYLDLSIFSKDEQRITTLASDELGLKVEANQAVGKFKFIIPKLLLRPGSYTVGIYSSVKSANVQEPLDVIERALTLTVEPGYYENLGALLRPSGYFQYYEIVNSSVVESENSNYF